MNIRMYYNYEKEYRWSISLKEENITVDIILKKWGTMMNNKVIAFIINDYFVYDIISLFQQNTEVGMIGVLGNTTDVNKNQIKDCNYGKILYGDATGVKKIELQDNEKFEDAQVVSEVLFITQYDLNWSEGTNEQYLAKQCQKYREKGWKVIIPYQKNIWVSEWWFIKIIGRGDRKVFLPREVKEENWY